MAGFELSFATFATTSLMFGVGIGHNAKRRIERQLFFQRLAEIITLAAQLVILRFQCRQLRQLLLLHLNALIKLAAQLATLALQACQLLGKLGEVLEPRFIELIHQENPWPRSTVAVMLQFVRPARASRILLGDNRLARMDESRKRVQ